MSVLVAGLLGCDGDVEQVTDRNGSSGNVCSGWRCGFTAPEVNGRSLQELSLAGVANLNGVRIAHGRHSAVKAVLPASSPYISLD